MSHRNFERILHFRVSPGSMPVSVSVQQTWLSSFRVVGGGDARCEVSCGWFSDRLRVLLNVLNCTSLCSKSGGIAGCGRCYCSELATGLSAAALMEKCSIRGMVGFG